jgi:hypothetical protein
MATLWWAWDKFTLSEPARDIREVKAAIAARLPELGYTSVASAETVQGAKEEYFLAVIFLCVGGRNFWQGVACGGNGPVPNAKAEVKQVRQMIATLQVPPLAS